MHEALTVRHLTERKHWLINQPDLIEFYTGKRVLVTGASGFIGRNVVIFLKSLGATVLEPSHRVFDLTNQNEAFHLFEVFKPIDLVIHLAAAWMGIGRTAVNPAKSFFDNLTMGVNVIDACQARNNTKVVVAGSVCAYPQNAPVPLREHNLSYGDPEPTNGPYGLAKRALLTMLQAYAVQYGMPSAYLLMGNTYGPNDNFDLETSHVIPALIRKFSTAKINNTPEVEIWGTGGVSRDFMYVTDAAAALVMAGARVCKPDPINIGSGEEVMIAWLASRMKEAVEYTGSIYFNRDKPEGQKRRLLNIDKAKELMGWTPLVPLSDGLRATLYWYFDETFLGGLDA